MNALLRIANQTRCYISTSENGVVTAAGADKAEVRVTVRIWGDDVNMVSFDSQMKNPAVV